MERYSRNMTSISLEENMILQKSRVTIVGCGGLGGYIIEMLARLGLGHIRVIDYDSFDISNLNRQLLSQENNIGMSKALEAKERLELINSDIKVEALLEYLDEANADELLANSDLVIDALDNIESRLLLEETCKKLGIPLVHGAIAGWYGQICSIFPGDDSLSKIYGANITKGIEKKLGNPSFSPSFIASLEVSEAVKILLKKGDILRKKLLFVDLLNNEFITIDI